MRVVGLPAFDISCFASQKPQANRITISELSPKAQQRLRRLWRLSVDNPKAEAVPVTRATQGAPSAPPAQPTTAGRGSLRPKAQKGLRTGAAGLKARENLPGSPGLSWP
jgi:hypothetical protein